MRTIFWTSGKSYIALYLSFFVCIALMIIDLFFGITTNEVIMKIFGTLILSFLSILLYYELEKKHKSDDLVAIEQSGISSYHTHLDNNILEELMTSPGRICVANTWIYNSSDLTLYFKEALKYDNTTIEISYLSPESKFVEHRARELDCSEEEVVNHIISRRNDFVFFLKKLSIDKQKRVKIFEFDATPRIVLHTNNDRGFIGFYWPQTMAIQSPQFFISGKSQDFPAAVWSYYNFIEKHREDVTEKLLLLENGSGANNKLNSDG